jgi:Tfp pilus assembly protein PilZ
MSTAYQMPFDELPDESRRHRRIPVRLPIRIGEGDDEVTLMSEDVSYSGVFLRTDMFLNSGDRIAMAVRIPDTGEDLKLVGVVAHCINWEQAATFQQGPGMGIQIYGFDRESLEQWNGFVARAMALNDARSLDDAARSVDEVREMVQPIRRRFPRMTAKFEVHATSVDDLFEMLSKDISAGGTFLLHEQLLPVRTPVSLAFVHPTDGSRFELSGEVVRVVESPPRCRGMGVHFVADTEVRAAFTDFIETGLPEASAAVELIPLLEGSTEETDQ